MKASSVQTHISKTWVLVVAMIAATAGCSHGELESRKMAREGALSREIDRQTVDVIRDSGIRAAIVTEHTIYSYHFVTDSSKLNDLGERDLTVLASHYKAHPPGLLSMNRANATGALYEMRTKEVMQALRDRGVNTDQLHMSDGPAGGKPGRSDDAVREVKEMRDYERAQVRDSDQSGSSTSSTDASSAKTQDASNSSGGQR